MPVHRSVDFGLWYDLRNPDAQRPIGLSVFRREPIVPKNDRDLICFKRSRGDKGLPALLREGEPRAFSWFNCRRRDRRAAIRLKGGMRDTAAMPKLANDVATP